MCRFVAYKGVPIVASKLLHEPKNSLIHQSHNAHEIKEPLNGDGFGFGWYAQDISADPALFRSMQPAWNDSNLLSIAEKTRTDCLVGHIRAATHGEVAQQNCHPFRHKSLLMMHNGAINGFGKIKRELRNLLSDDIYHWVRGQTDSEHLFALFLENLRKESVSVDTDSPEDVYQVLTSTINQIESLKNENNVADVSLLNLCITNGHWITATRYISDGSEAANTLYYSAGSRYECIDGQCTMTASSEDERSVLVVSEKLTSVQDDWVKVPVNHGVIVDKELGVTVLAGG